MAREDRVDEPLLLGEWRSERKSVEVRGFLSASLILSLVVAFVICLFWFAKYFYCASFMEAC